MPPDRPSASPEQIALEWISYQLWSRGRQRPEAPTPEQLANYHKDANSHGFSAWEAAYGLVVKRPEDGWLMILRFVDPDPDDYVLACVAAGPLEDLLGRQPYVSIDRVEEQGAKRREVSAVCLGRVGLDAG